TGPLAVTSANLSGEPPSTTLAEAQSVFGERVDAYLDGGACDGEPSTVLSLTNGPRVLRAGGLPEEELLRRFRRRGRAS
ncbi:MAG: Sua5/YciO/YrdC/YwlC family protein, partial [Actinomycetota bacterium]|nr:Sua5/YciO/YrdC/YwlC family protein [Actinomycetota bacterium]